MPRWRALAAVLLALALAGILIAFGALDSPRRGDILTDRLGPAPSEPVADYLDRAAASLVQDGETRYALVSFTSDLAPADALATVSGARVSELIYHVPIPRVQTPIVAVAVPDNADAAIRSADVAAERVLANEGRTERATQVAGVAAARLAAGCACVAGALVRADTETLETIAKRDRVRAVEALPADAVYGRIAITPLLPDQDVIAGPGADDGPVPAR